MAMEELLAAASVLAMVVDSDGEDGSDLEDVCGGAAAASPASDVVEAEKENNSDLPAGGDSRAAQAKVSLRPISPVTTPSAPPLTC